MANPFLKHRISGSDPVSSDVGSIQLGIKSPWAEGDGLGKIVLADLIGVDPESFPLSRASAMTLPAVSAARNLLISVISSLPLKTYTADGEIQDQPAWLYRAAAGQSAYFRLSLMVDDLLFHGHTMLAITRGAEDRILSAVHIPVRDWKVEKGRVYIFDKPVTEKDFIYIPSPFDGLLNVANRTLRQALAIENTVASRAANPSPITVIRNTTDQDLEQDEIDDLLSQYRTARRAIDGAVAYLPSGLELVQQQDDGYKAFLLEARNAVVSDVAKFTGLPSALLEGSSTIDSLTYTTEKGQRSRFVDFSLRMWLDPIQHRLSQDDVTPRGTDIRFDLAELIDSPSTRGLDGPTQGTPEAPVEPPKELPA
jgi:phage portal protein BeeE